jgi:hypothetical protein
MGYGFIAFSLLAGDCSFITMNKQKPAEEN